MSVQKRPSMCLVSSQQEVIEEGDEEINLLQESRGEPDGGEDVEGLPWHHAQLVMLYGRHVADDFIRPKMEQNRNAKVNPKLKNKEGLTGANQLWSALRNDSIGKLLKEDKKIPTGLKNSYGAFVRQLVLQKGQVPVKRNFYESEDVPDMNHLLDRKKLLHTLDIRHKIELMGRSSKINQDKTNILLYNNPLPDIVNTSSNEGIYRYLPSWAEQDQESVASYRKWLNSEDRLLPAIKPSDSLVELVRPLTRDTSRHQGPPRVTFLTELEAGAEKGKFSEKYKEQKDMEHSIVNPADNGVNILIDDVHLKPFRGDNVKSASSDKSLSKMPKSTWEPLTLNALIEYSEKKSTYGAGSFLNGSMKMYPVNNSAGLPS